MKDAEEFAMDFKEAYKELGEKFKNKVEDDRTKGIDSILLPNIAPAGPVDYVLIGMEPSLGNWARNQDPARRMSIAEERIRGGFSNWCGVWTLHHPVRKYLCRDGETYYVTDLAKGAMLTNSPAAGDERKYQDWYELLEEELGLVAKQDAKIISIGHKVGGFLSGKNIYAHAGIIPHYSTQAARSWGKEAESCPSRFEEFAASLDSIPNNICMPGHQCRPATKQRDVPLSEPRKKLLFDYKVRFARIREQETSGWRKRQRQWQSLIS